MDTLTSERQAKADRDFRMMIALAALKRLRSRYAVYLEYCADMRREGYAPHYCFHGTNLWTDYDNICGPCEDGYSLHQLALFEARDVSARLVERRAIWKAAMFANAPETAVKALGSWTFEAAEEYLSLTGMTHPRNLP